MSIHKKILLFGCGYAGGSSKIEIKIADKWYIIDNDDIADLIINKIEKDGSRIEQTKRQKYPRLKFGTLNIAN